MLRIINGAVVIFIIASLLFIYRIQKEISLKKQIRFSDGFKLKIISAKDLQLYKNDLFIDIIKNFKGNYIKYYLIGEKGYYIFNIFTRMNKFYNDESIPVKEMQKINHLFKKY